MYRKTAKKLLKFIEKSPTAFQAVTEMTKRLDKEGYTSQLPGTLMSAQSAVLIAGSVMLAGRFLYESTK